MTVACQICSQPLPYRPNGRGHGRPRKVHPACRAEANRRAVASWRADRQANGTRKALCDVCNVAEVPPGRGFSRYCSPKCCKAGANVLRKARRHAAAESAGKCRRST